MEKYYKDEQAYRNRNGGVDFDEFKNIAKKERKKYSDTQIQEAFLIYKKNELENWNWAGLEEYYQSIENSEEDDYDCGGCFIVPDRTNAEAFVHYLSEYDLVLEEHAEKIGRSVRKESDIPALFERINNSRSPESRAKECGKISFPIEGTVFQLAS